jgi:hypothetical protein
VDGGLVQSGPDAFHISTPLELGVERNATIAAFTASRARVSASS